MALLQSWFDFLLSLILKFVASRKPLEPAVPSAYEDAPWMHIVEADLALDWAERSPGDNPLITECFDLCGYGRLPDETAWCGVYAGRTLIKAGFKPPKDCAWARNYSSSWGTALTEPKFGCLVNIERGSAGGSSHVGFCVSWDAEQIRLTGGNQSNSVTNSLVVPRSSVLSYKMPKEKLAK